jgi:two-component system, OmpR family, sensor histidine kinase MtrB
LLKRWRRSLVLRVTVTIVALSMIIIWLIGSALYSQVSTGIFKEKLNVSIADATSTSRSTQLQLSIAQYQDKATVKMIINEILSVPSVSGSNSGREIALFPFPKNTSATNYRGTSNLMSPKSVADSFRTKTRAAKGPIWERTDILYLGGKIDHGIVVGNILEIPSAGKYEIYVLFSLSQQNATLTLIGRSLWLTGIVLTLLLGILSWLVLRQLIAPVRDAARIAEQLTAGDLDQRMDIRGEDEIARLGYAFNEMAVSLKQQISRLENLSRLQQRFVSDVSHELRTPLTTMRMASQVLYSAKDGFEPAVARSAELLASQIDRFEALLNDLLEVSRFDAEAAVMEIREVDFIALVREAIDYVHPSQERIIELHAPSEPIIVDVDPRRIQRILRNLLTNAIDHREEKTIDITIAQSEDAVSVGVRDYGVGFSNRDRSSLFERFWRADPSRARVRGGTGLGLSIAMEDAKLHQGKLEAWGLPSKGAHFVLTLPKFSGGTITSTPIQVIPRGDF